MDKAAISATRRWLSWIITVSRYRSLFRVQRHHRAQLFTWRLHLQSSGNAPRKHINRRRSAAMVIPAHPRWKQNHRSRRLSTAWRRGLLRHNGSLILVGSASYAAYAAATCIGYFNTSRAMMTAGMLYTAIDSLWRRKSLSYRAHRGIEQCIYYHQAYNRASITIEWHRPNVNGWYFYAKPCFNAIKAATHIIA